MGNGWEMVGSYPAYLLQAGAFLARIPFFVYMPFSYKMHVACVFRIMNNVFWGVFIVAQTMFIIIIINSTVHFSRSLPSPQ